LFIIMSICVFIYLYIYLSEQFFTGMILNWESI